MSRPIVRVGVAAALALSVHVNNGGLLSTVVVHLHTGCGTFTVACQGNSLQGETTCVDSAPVGFGCIHDEVLGTPPRSRRGQRGIANSFGAKGVTAQREYVITGAKLGTGGVPVFRRQEASAALWWVRAWRDHPPWQSERRLSGVDLNFSVGRSKTELGQERLFALLHATVQFSTNCRHWHAGAR